jgi:methionyl aminopeptidase
LISAAVFTRFPTAVYKPFLSKGAIWATEGDDGWTLYSEPRAPVVQYEHTVVATDRGAIIVTLPD